VTMNTLAGLAGHLPHAAIHWRLACQLGISASAGSLAGARLAKRVDAGVLRRVLAVLMLAAAVALLGKVAVTSS
jgi:uncharacterized membrane protein YfcA